jgi:nitrite reductase (NADH) large subunit
MKRILILGGGIAGTTAAEELRKRDADCAITILEQEHHPLYSRVLLPHYVKGKIPREKVFLKTWEWYTQQRIEMMSGVRVEHIDVRNHFVTTSEGRELPFDVLILAGGGEMNVFGGEPRGVSYLRGIDDADELVQYLAEIRMKPEHERRAVVIGGGFIALEYINVFAHFGIASEVVMRGSGFWSQILSRRAQDILAAHATKHGVILHTNEVVEIFGDREVEGVRLGSGSVRPASVVGVGIGMHPDRRFYDECGIAIDRGICVNAYLETEHSGIYAIGDGAEFFDLHVGRSVVYGNWMNAQMQGRTVAKTMLGERTVFDCVSSYATQLLGMHVVFIGDCDRSVVDEIRVTMETNTSMVEEFYRNGRVVGAIFIGDVSSRAGITAKIKENRYEM